MRRRIAPSLVVLFLAALVSGCGSGEPDLPSAEPTTSAAEDEDVSDDDTDADADADAADRAALAGAVVFSVSDKFTLFEDGPGVINLAGTAQVGVLRPGDGLEIQGGGPDTGTTILAIRVGVPSVEVDALAPGEFGYLVVAGTLDDFTFTEQLVRPID